MENQIRFRICWVRGSSVRSSSALSFVVVVRRRSSFVVRRCRHRLTFPMLVISRYMQYELRLVGQNGRFRFRLALEDRISGRVFVLWNGTRISGRVFRRLLRRLEEESDEESSD